jgi:isopenicillin N synthase-like dioxygenase
MKKRSIPLVDLSRFTRDTPAQQQAFVQGLGRAFHEIGFVGVVNHGIGKKLITDFYAVSNAFFALPVEVKKSMKWRGWRANGGTLLSGRSTPNIRMPATLRSFTR